MDFPSPSSSLPPKLWNMKRYSYFSNLDSAYYFCDLRQFMILSEPQFYHLYNGEQCNNKVPLSKGGED